MSVDASSPQNLTNAVVPVPELIGFAQWYKDQVRALGKLANRQFYRLVRMQIFQP